MSSLRVKWVGDKVQLAQYMKKKRTSWYSINFVGGLVTSLYGLLPVYIVYIDNLGLLTSPVRLFAIGGMLFVTVCAGSARASGRKLFSRYKDRDTGAGFTLIELLIVISIIGILAAIMLPAFSSAREAAYLSRTKEEMHSMSVALELYANDHGNYPPDADRNVPPGLEPYLSASGSWPNAPWPGSVYDWDAWAPDDLAYAPQQQVYQISIRFCPVNQPTQCRFPNESWAKNFDYYSAVYYCISGPCRAHSSQPVDHAGYCVNC